MDKGERNISKRKSPIARGEDARRFLERSRANEEKARDIVKSYKSKFSQVMENSSNEGSMQQRYTLNEEEALKIINAPVHKINTSKYTHSLHLSEEERKERARRVLDNFKRKEDDKLTMRSSERIERINSLVKEIWSKEPDTRYMQLISNISAAYSEENDERFKEYAYRKEEIGDTVIFEKNMPVIDLFYLEDDELEGFLERYLDNL